MRWKTDPKPPVVLGLGRTVHVDDGSVDLRSFESDDHLLEALERDTPAAVVLEHDPDRIDGLAALRRVREAEPDVSTLLWTDAPDGEVAAAATRLGVTEYATRDGDHSLTGRVRTVAHETQTPSEGSLWREPSTSGPTRMLERVDDAFVAIDADWEFTYASPRSESVFEVSADEVVGRDARDVLPMDVREPLQRAIRTQIPVTFERWFDTLERWLLVSAYPHEDGLRVYARDTSEERRYRRALSTLLETASDLMVAETEMEVAQITVDAVADIVGFELNGIRRYDPATNRLELLCATREAETTISTPETVRPGENLQGKAFESEKTIVVDDTFEESEEQYESVRAAATVPLGEYGTLTVGSFEPGGINGVDRDLLELLGLSAEAALARAAREESLREYRAVHESVDQMVYTLDEGGHISLITQPMAERFGYERSDLIGEHIGTLLPEEDVRKGERLVRELQSEPQGTSRTYETTITPPEGDPFPVEVDVSLFRRDREFRGTVGVVRDVSELHQARAELADERDRFAYLFEQLPDAVVEADFFEGEPVVRAVNAAFETVFGYEADTVVGEPLNQFVVPSGEEASASDIDRRTRSGEVVRQEVRRETASGTREFLFTGVPYDTDGETVRGFAIYTDITEQRDRERRLQVLYRVLRHNLRNDMNVVTGNAADLRVALEGIDSPLVELADTIYERAVDVVDISRKTGNIQRAMDSDAVPCAVELDWVVEQAVENVTRRHPEAEFDVSVPNVTVQSTGGLVRAVENVVENGVVHSDVSHPTVRVTLDRSTPEGYVDLRIADDGPGIPSREKAVLTDDDEITQLHHSRGLGLWTARWVVDASGGELGFEDEADGAVVVFRLALAPDGEDES